MTFWDSQNHLFIVLCQPRKAAKRKRVSPFTRRIFELALQKLQQTQFSVWSRITALIINTFEEKNAFGRKSIFGKLCRFRKSYWFRPSICGFFYYLYLLYMYTQTRLGDMGAGFATKKTYATNIKVNFWTVAKENCE
jgi:hypothetical protein